MPPKTPPPQDLRETIRARMRELAITQDQLAAATAKAGTRISPAMLRLFLNQNQAMSTDRLESVCKALRLRLQLVAER